MLSVQPKRSNGTKPLTFALDYDDTFTACPDLLSVFIRRSILLGHSWYLVTARRDSPENLEEITANLSHWDCLMPIIFCNLKSKFDTVTDRGIRIDIWIDDAPHAIVHGY